MKAKIFWLYSSLALLIIIGVFIWRPCMDFLRKVNHGQNLGSLGELTNAIYLYKRDQGFPPTSLRDLMPKYMHEIPKVRLIGYGHLNSALVEQYPFLDSKGDVDSRLIKDTGHWIYDSKTGKITVDCTHVCFSQCPYYDISRIIGLSNTGAHFW